MEPTTEPIDAALETIVMGLEKAWNDASAEEFAKYFAEDADFVNIYGTHGKGRPAIADAHDVIFRTVYAGSAIRIEVNDVRLPREDVAVVHARSRLSVPEGPLAGELNALPTIVLTREDGVWTIAAFHNTLVTPPPPLHNNGQRT